MKIGFDSSSARFNYPFRIIGDAGRYDTISDCEFLDDTHIVCVDRQMARLYLIEFDVSGNTHTILDSAECVVDKKPQHFELISVRRMNAETYTLYSVIYSNTLFSCTIVNNKFCNFRTVVVNSGDSYHGVCAIGSESVYVTNMVKIPTITEYNTITGTKRTFECKDGVRMKDVAVLDDNHIVALSSDRGPINGSIKSDGTVMPHSNYYDSHILVYNIAGSTMLIDKHILKNTQIDAVVFRAPFCYVTYTDAKGTGYILRCRLDSSHKFTEDIVKIPCGGFPHGISIYNNKLAYTSYTDSALYIHTFSDYGQLEN